MEVMYLCIRLMLRTWADRKAAQYHHQGRRSYSIGFLRRYFTSFNFCVDRFSLSSLPFVMNRISRMYWERLFLSKRCFHTSPVDYEKNYKHSLSWWGIMYADFRGPLRTEDIIHRSESVLRLKGGTTISAAYEGDEEFCGTQCPTRTRHRTHQSVPRVSNR